MNDDTFEKLIAETKLAGAYAALDPYDQREVRIKFAARSDDQDIRCSKCDHSIDANEALCSDCVPDVDCVKCMATVAAPLCVDCSKPAPVAS